MTTARPHIDWLIFFSALTLMLFSIAFVYSAGIFFATYKGMQPEGLLMSHFVKVIIAVIIMIFVSRIDYHFWSKISIWLMLLSLITLIIVLVAGKKVGGAERWINLGFMTFQPSELAKFSMIIHFATLINRKGESIKELKYGYFPFMLWIALFSSLIALQPNFSMIIILFLIGIFMLYLGNANIKHILTTLALTSLVGAVYAVSAPYRLNRLLFYMGMLEGKEFDKLAYQVDNSLVAIGSGGLFGMGPGGSHQNLLLSEPYTDFILSIIGEEYGFIGLVVIIVLFIFILWRGFYLAKRVDDRFGFLLISGIIFSIFISFLINAFVNTALIPTTGVPLPFLSYGGTSIFFGATLIGILLNISVKVSTKEIKKNQKED